MAELLGRETPLDVVVAEDGDEPRLGTTVHVCPPGVDLVIRGGVIRLLPPARRRVQSRRWTRCWPRWRRISANGR